MLAKAPSRPLTEILDRDRRLRDSVAELCQEYGKPVSPGDNHSIRADGGDPRVVDRELCSARLVSNPGRSIPTLDEESLRRVRTLESRRLGKETDLLARDLDSRGECCDRNDPEQSEALHRGNPRR